MTDDRMALAELLQPTIPHLSRSSLHRFLQILMEADVEGLIGAGRHERTGDRSRACRPQLETKSPTEAGLSFKGKCAPSSDSPLAQLKPQPRDPPGQQP